ncbi:MAG: hypothetical protein GQ476_03645 [Candidatus Aminicenantes bacterium]|jgi:hypothetical protein|nr:hypothetical protein [Candidatus Aminicenantes bacterium]
MKKIILTFLCFILLLFISVYGKLELLGPLSKEEILENFPDWQVEVASYVPDQEVIEKLQSIPSEIKIEIFLGTWCPDTKRNVSAYFKIMDMVDNPLIMTSYIGIPREDDSRKPFIEGKNIIKVPTFIIIIDNQEKGRIIENPTKSVEEDVLDIINK